MFGPKRDANKQLRNFIFYRFSNAVRVVKSTRLKWERHVARMEAGRRTFKVLTGKARGTRPVGTARHK